MIMSILNLLNIFKLYKKLYTLIKLSIIFRAQISHNVPAVGEVLGARIGKRKGNPFHTPLRFQGT